MQIGIQRLSERERGEDKMCGVVGGREAASLEYGESSCIEAGQTYGGHATEEQYREAANRRLQPDVESEEGAEVYSEGEMAPREGFR